LDLKKACFDINNTQVDLKTCKIVFAEYEKCCKDLSKEKLKSQGISGLRP
jgi:hypothetical protein